MVQLFTSRWSAKSLIARSGLGAVRTSLGAPKDPGFEVIGSIPELMPERAWMHAPLEEYRPRYLAKLEQAGVERLLQVFQELGERSPSGLVLLCFENVQAPKPGQFCHRRLFAAWWLTQTGEVVDELTAAHVAAPPTHPKPLPQREQSFQPRLL